MKSDFWNYTKKFIQQLCREMDQDVKEVKLGGVREGKCTKSSCLHPAFEIIAKNLEMTEILALC